MAKKPTSKKPAAKKAAPLDAPAATPAVAQRAAANDRDPTLEAIYEQGREARRNAIARADAPHPDGEALKTWQQGWDYEDDHRGRTKG